MEVQERSRSPSRAKRVEQAVGRWLRRSRDSISRERKSADGRCGGAGACGPLSTPIRVTVQILRDPQLASHGFSVSDQPPLQVRDVTSGGPADGKLVPGDQLLQINNITTDDLSPEQAAVIISEVPDSVTMTVLRQSSGPKSSFMTAEKRARLRSNPVKVRFAEEVVVNGHAQGNSLLFLPNVLKVYLENGQTKAFKFGATTTVKDILDTLKEKLSIRCIGYFALVLEQQSSTSRLLLLHEEEIIQKVVQKKDTRDYRCLFRVSFLPRDPLELLQCDPVAFEYLYLQSVSDVLRERFAVEMKCNTALCLAALHMQERLHSCGQMHKTSVKSITKEWGIENFISPTLLRNMKEKDLRKAISYHMKKTRSLLEPRQKVLSVVQARLNYLKQLSDLMSYGGKFFTATMMFQGRETVVNLLVGARYGISQVVNHKLNLLSPLIEFSSIGRVELMPESEKLSLVRIFAQDMKPVILLMEPVAAKDLSCVVSGYCKLEAERSQAVFLLANPPREHRISAEEGYESRGCSDSEESSEEEDDDEGPVEDLSKNEAAAGEEENLEKGEDDGGEEKMQTEEDPEICAAAEGPEDPAEMNRGEEGVNERRSEEQLDEKLFLELSDFCHTDARVDASFSSDSMEALIEDTIIPHRPGAVANPQACHTGHAEVSAETEQNAEPVASRPADIDYDNNRSLCFAELSRMVNFLPSPPAASEEEEEQVDSACVPQEDHISTYGEIQPPCPNNGHLEGSSLDQPQTVNILKSGEQSQSPIHVPQPSTLFGDSISDDEFFDAPDAPSVSAAESTSEKQPEGNTVRLQSLREGTKEEERTGKRRGGQQTSELEPSVKKCHKRQASIHKTDGPIDWEEMVCHYGDKPSDTRSCAGITSLSGSRKEPTEARSSPSSSSPLAGCYNGEAQGLSSELVEIERVSMVVEPTKVQPSATTVSSPTVTHSTKTENCGMYSSNREIIEENHCTTATADVRSNTTGAPITEKYDAAMLEGSPGRRSLSGPHLTEQSGQGLSSAKTTSSQTPSPSLHPHILTSSASGPKTDWRNNSNKDINQQDMPPPFRLDLRKRNSCFALLLRNGMSPSYENLLRSEMEALGVKDTSAIGGLGASAKQLRGLGLQGCSSTMGNRLSSSMIRCKIQKLPWYLSRPQEPHVASGNDNLDKSYNSSGSSESSQCITEIKEVMRRDEKYPAKTSEVGNHSEEQANLPADSHLLEISRCAKNDGSLLVASSLDRKPEIHMQSNPSFECQRPVTQFGVEETSNTGVDCFTESSNPKETCPSLQECESVQPHPLPQPWPHLCPGTSATAGCSSDSGQATKQPHREACGCRTVYANCFSGDSDGSGFDEELTVHEFSRKTQGAEGVHLTSPVLSSFSFPSSPDLPKDSLSLPATPDVSRLLPFPESRNGVSATFPDEALTQLRTRRYRLPGGFTSLQQDVEELLALLQGVTSDLPGQETGDTLFSDSGRLLHAEARRLMSGCQQVTRVGQTPDEMLQCLADGFRALVRLACSCLHSRGSSESRAQALRVLQEIAGAYGEFARAAERVSGRETCQDLSIKLLARQCTSLTTSIFCLTQLFCTITSL